MFTSFARRRRRSSLARLFRRHAIAATVASCVAALTNTAPLRAQQADPVDDLITRVIADVNDLRYADAITRGRELLTFSKTMRPAQEALLRSVLAAAYYPEETDAQQPDSAIAQFAAGIRVQPDLALPIELRWAGLDSLLSVARARTFAIVVSADEQSLVGPGATAALSVHSSRPARFTLRTSLLGSAVQTPQSSTTAADTHASLSYRAHDGRDLLLAPGEYVATIVAVDPNTGDSTVVTRRVLVEGAPLLIVAPPAFDSTQLRPETSKPPMLRTMLTALAVGTATFIIGSLGGGDDDFGDDFEPDGRSIVVGLAIFGAGASTYWLDKGKADPEAVAANTALRDAHRKAVEDAAAESARRLREYRVTVKFPVEAR